NSTDNSNYVVAGSDAVDSSAVLDGFYVSASKTRGIYRGSPTVRNCTFTANSIAMEISTPTVTDCTFDGNGYGIYHPASTLTNCLFTNNTTTGIDMFVPGSVTISGCTFAFNAVGISSITNITTPPILITACTFSGNTIGIRNTTTAPTIEDCYFNGNAT